MQSPLQILWDAGDLSSLTRDDIDAKEHVTSWGGGWERKEDPRMHLQKRQR